MNDRPADGEVPDGPLTAYLAWARSRLRWRSAARTAAGVAAGALAASLVGGWVVSVTIPSAGWLTGVRALLLLVLAALLWRLWRRRSDLAMAAAEMESRVPAFGGRLRTWLDGYRRDDSSPLFALLARETRDVAAAHPPARVVAAWELLLPAGVAMLGAILIALTVTGSRPWQLAAQRLWLGDLLAASQPGVAVEPGDVVVRAGSDVVIRASARGFRAAEMTLNVDFGADGWQQAPMADLGEGEFSFVLVGVTDALEYYVGAEGLASARHRIRVADLPRITRVETEHHLPEWTGVDATRHGRGDVIALPGTRVQIRAFSDRPVTDPLLVVDDAPSAMHPLPGDSEPAQQATLEVAAPGSWYVAVRHEGELARISDRFLIEIAEDAAPEVAFTWPGHDRRASPIEEVALAFEATDDYRVEGLSLHVAANGGAWKQVPLEQGEHVLRLESMTVGAGDGQRPLIPGDVISFYAEARDHAQSTRSSLYFVDVRPFEMRYRESQQMGSQGASEGSGFDIAERQRDLLSATWNLVNKRADMAPQALADEAEVLATLQRTLHDQVRTLVERSAARGLGAAEGMADFIGALNRAMDEMLPAADRLQSLELDAAVPPEQRALAHLTAAEASVREVQVSLSRNQGRGTSGRSLEELVELEMDPARNRYEVPQQPTLEPGAESSVDEEAWQRLDDLAARQERLSRQDSADRNSLPARWEQARLQREIEQLRDTLEARRGQSGEQRGGALDRAIGDLERANGALAEAQTSGRPAGGQAAAALRNAAQALRASARGDLQQRLDRAENRVANLEADQARVMEALQGVQQDSLERARNGEGIGSSEYAMQSFAEVKRRMQEDLSALRGELTGLSRELGERHPSAAGALDRALAELSDARVDERLAASADAFDMGQPLYVIGSESVVEQALLRLGRRVNQAAQSVAAGADATPEDPLREVQTLRRRLEEAAEGGSGANRQAVVSVARALDDLQARTDAGGGAAPRGGTATEPYRIRGIDDANTERLLTLTRERLDLVEAMLSSRDGPPVAAQDPRPEGRDSPAAARYFRALGRGGVEED